MNKLVNNTLIRALILLLYTYIYIYIYNINYEAYGKVVFILHFLLNNTHIH